MGGGKPQSLRDWESGVSKDQCSQPVISWSDEGKLEFQSWTLEVTLTILIRDRQQVLGRVSNEQLPRVCKASEWRALPCNWSLWFVCMCLGGSVNIRVQPHLFCYAAPHCQGSSHKCKADTPPPGGMNLNYISVQPMTVWGPRRSAQASSWAQTSFSLGLVSSFAQVLRDSQLAAPSPPLHPSW